MAVDKYGNAMFKKSFWADGGWYVVFLLLPLLAGLVILTIILIYGVYFTFRYDAEHVKAGFLFIVFAFLTGLTVVSFAKTVWTLLTEKIVFDGERIIYQGFGSYSLAYRSISRVVLRERRGPFGQEKYLTFVGRDNPGRERFYIIPRWKTLSGGILADELAKHMTLNLLDRGLLAYYSAVQGRDWLLPLLITLVATVNVILFFIARTSSDAIASVTVFFWFFLSVVLIFFLSRYINLKKEVLLA